MDFDPELEKVLASLARSLRLADIELALCGRKKPKLSDCPSISSSSGFWESPTYVTNKPLRWLIHADAGRSVTVSFASEGSEELFGARRIGFANTTKGRTVALGVRIIPAVTQNGKRRIREDLECVAVFAFPHLLPTGSSGQLFEYSGEDRRYLNYLGRAVEIASVTLVPTGDGLRTAVGEPYLRALQEFLGGAGSRVPVTLCTHVDQLEELESALRRNAGAASGRVAAGSAGKRLTAMELSIAGFKLHMRLDEKVPASAPLLEVDLTQGNTVVGSVNSRHPYVEASRRAGAVGEVFYVAAAQALAIRLSKDGREGTVSLSVLEKAHRLVGLARDGSSSKK